MKTTISRFDLSFLYFFAGAFFLSDIRSYDPYAGWELIFEIGKFLICTILWIWYWALSARELVRYLEARRHGRRGS